ncbi:tubulointerstitial nephritis antigen like 1, transcript variant X3 [Ictidomys tridecemlineatus]|nr:tubulointerstitial nephritis antigen like 1, transcript variant X3 [Ictidomys tridecemlineatus]
MPPPRFLVLEGPCAGGTMWRCPSGLLLLLLLAGQGALGARRGRWRRELAPGLHLRGIRDAGGRYCQEQDMCCRGRADDCALPYLGATCYCDLFCNRTVSDCCPDFWDFCLGVPPPFPPIQGCEHGGRIYPVFGTYWDNCNRCTCQEKGQWECDQEPCLVDLDMINAINQGNYGWQAGNHSAFWGMTLDEGIRYRLGTIRPSSSVMNMNEIYTVLSPGEVLPTAFEASEKWPNLIHEPLDQGNCAGSWAFSTAAVASDRVSIHSLGHMTPVLSPQNLLSCDTHHQQGCHGGHLDGAWWFLRRRGVVSDHCYPFSGRERDEAGPAPPCMMHSRAMGRGAGDHEGTDGEWPRPSAHGGSRGLLPVPGWHLQPHAREPEQTRAVSPTRDPLGQDHRVGRGAAARRKDAQILDRGQLMGPLLG